MPTGYTSAVADGKITELEPFVWRLARGMGALIMMRDEPADAPVPERFEPSRYNAEELIKLRAEIGRLSAMSDEEATAAADAEHKADEEAKAEYFSEEAQQRARYQSMIARLEAWQGAPEGIKEFGLEQLHQSLDFDCREPFSWYREPVERDGPKWRDAKIAKLARDIEYHVKADTEERARTDACNAWVAQLRQSLARNEHGAKAVAK
jgi:hypothetical protein